MNRLLIIKTLGLVLLCEAALLLPSFLLSLARQETDARALFFCLLLTASVGGLMMLARPHSTQVGYREGFVIAALAWFFCALFGALPYLFTGTLDSLADAFFEAMSGFTTTGASVIKDVEVLSHGLLLWRSTTHWLGGMGIIVLTLALIPSLKIAGMQLFKAEVPGPTKSKMVPRIVNTSRELYKVYLIITAAEIVLLKLAGMDLFDAVIHTFGTVATGGFSSKNLSIGAYDSLAIELIITFFMIICGMNFALHFYLLKGKWRPLWEDSETRLYLGIIAASTLLIGWELSSTLGLSWGQALRQALFQVSSIITTTGFASADFDSWPPFSKFVLLALMFIGGCAGSTGGGIKSARLLILIKAVSRQVTRLLHPQAVVPVRLGTGVVSREVVESVQNFFFLYIMILAAATLAIAALGIDMLSSLSAVAATLGNVGPGFGLVGPMTNYADLPEAAKWILSLCMLTGRLEIYTVLVFFSIKTWRD